MRNFISPKTDYQVFPKQGIVRTQANYTQKITGTTLGAIIGKNPYMSPFAASTKLMGLWDEDISDKPAVYTGRMLEEPIIEYLGSHHTDVGNFWKVEELPFEKREGAHESWESDFEDDVFAGHIDGMVSRDGQDYILEIKTANREKIERSGDWIVNGVPEHYLWQVYLYNHFLTKQDKAYFGLGIVDSHVYENPRMWVPNKDNCRLFEIKIDQKKVAAALKDVRQLFLDTIAQGKTVKPADPDNANDMEILNHLSDIGGTMLDLDKLCVQYQELKQKNKTHMDAIADDVKKEEELKGRILDCMGEWKLCETQYVRIQTQNRKSFDWKAADADGLDVSKYTKNTTVNILKTIKSE